MKKTCAYIFLMVLLFANIHYAQETIKYNLSKSGIESVSYKISPDSTYSIFIKLNKKEANEFKMITKNNVGKLLQIFKGKHLIQEAVIEGEIPGLISKSNLKNSDNVIKYIQILLE